MVVTRLFLKSNELQYAEKLDSKRYHDGCGGVFCGGIGGWRILQGFDKYTRLSRQGLLNAFAASRLREWASFAEIFFTRI